MHTNTPTTDHKQIYRVPNIYLLQITDTILPVTFWFVDMGFSGMFSNPHCGIQGPEVDLVLIRLNLALWVSPPVHISCQPNTNIVITELTKVIRCTIQ